MRLIVYAALFMLVPFLASLLLHMRGVCSVLWLLVAPGIEQNRAGSDLVATVECHSRRCFWYNVRHEKLSSQSSQPMLSSHQPKKD